MIGLELLIEIHRENRTEFLQLFDMVAAVEHPIEGRICLELFELVAESNTFLWREHWESDEFLNLYYQENKFRAMVGAINILGQLVHKKTFIFMEENQDD